MMRVVLLALALLLPLTEGLAQQAQQRDWIFFCDKPGDSAVEAPAPPGARAAARRARRGSAAATLTRPVAPAYLDALHAAGVAPHVVSRWLNAVSAPLTDAQREAVRTLPFVCGVRPVAATAPHHVEPASPVPQVFAASLYGPSATQLATINAHRALERGFNGAGVVVGFLDTEYGDFQHLAFQRMRDEGRLLGTKNFAPGPQSSRHGQSVASIAVGHAEHDLVGPAWGASVLAATTEYAPTETNAEEDAFVAGLEWLEAQGADVVNVSLGYTEFDLGQRSYSVSDLDGDTGVTTRAADAAVALGVVVVTSAGNEGCATPSACWYYIGTPADGDSVIAVGAVRADSVKTSFSSFGPTADGRIKPDVAAQGQQVWYATGLTGYASGSGTSFSSPLVAGVVAQILQANPDLTPIEVRALLRASASQASAPDNRLGWGIIDADRAVDLALAARTTDADEAGPPRPLRATAVPNPSVGPVHFRLSGTSGTPYTLEVYDLVGRRLAGPLTGTLSGTTRVDLGVLLPAGVYLYRLTTPAASTTGTFLRLR